MKRIICVFTLLSACIFGIHAQQKVTRIADVVYDHRDGLAFVLDVIKPEKQNGAAILYILSGGWVSRPASAMSTESFKQFTDKGYTVFRDFSLFPAHDIMFLKLSEKFSVPFALSALMQANSV